MMYKATKKWQPNQYMQLFVKDGILYFLSYVSPLSFISVYYFTFSPTGMLLSTICKQN